LFLVFDSFRADEFYGNDKTSKTPNIDSLVKSGTYFTQAIPSADGTTLSLNSIFTGLYPFVTGTREIKLSFENRNYVEALREFGYNIYGIMPKLTSFSPLYSMCINKDATYEGGPPAQSLFDGLGQKIISLLQTEMKEPWFCYVHVMDLHWPLVVPDEYDDPQYGTSKYEKVVSSVDYWIGKIMSHIDATKTLVVITADHATTIPADDKDVTEFEPSLDLGLKVGKRLMPKSTHGFGAKLFIKSRRIIQNARLAQANKNLTEYEKRSRLPYYTLSLFDESIRVPLLFVGCGVKSTIITQQVRSVDIFPTIAEIIDLSYREKTHGASLLPLFAGQKLDEQPVYLHTMPYQEQSPDDMVGIRTSQYKYFRGSRDSTHNVNLYDLQNDPFENINIAKDNPNLVAKMEKILAEIIANTPTKQKQALNKDEEEQIRNELKKLGYV